MIIEARKLTRTYTVGSVDIHALTDVSLEVMAGELIAIMGKSGAGKSTLLYQLGLLDEPTSGELIVDNVSINELSAAQRTQFRLENLGYIFQDYAVLPELTAIENVVVPLMMNGDSRTAAYRKADEALQKVGLGLRLNNLPSGLSGGEQQRVAIARAIANRPKILFADEPTASLDTATSESILSIFKELNDQGQTIVLVTHEHIYGKVADRIIELEDGSIISDVKTQSRSKGKSGKKSKRS